MRALANGLNNCVNQKAWKTTILLGWLCALVVLAVVLAIAIKEFVSKQLLNAIQQKFHEARNFGL